MSTPEETVGLLSRERKRNAETHRILAETEQIGVSYALSLCTRTPALPPALTMCLHAQTSILGNLQRDRESLEASRRTVKETDGQLREAGQLTSSIARRAWWRKMCLVATVVGLLALIALIIALKVAN